jgi:hypothetical protein
VIIIPEALLQSLRKNFSEEWTTGLPGLASHMLDR